MSCVDHDIEVSAIMPCLNEKETIARCVEKAINCFAALGVRGEVVVADNGSTDRSPERGWYTSPSEGTELHFRPLWT
jgi:GT2 family glycosyltransferase